MTMIPDPYDQFVKHEWEKEEWLQKLPVCHWRQEHIQQETAVLIDGNWICDECLDDRRVYTWE